MATLDAVQAPAIAVVGSMNMDLVTYVDRVPGPGETVLGRRFESGFGGKGANQAVMARLLGAEVAFVGALGDDPYAEMTLENFARLGIETGGVMRVPGSSGLAPIWVEPDGMNRIVVVPGANGLVDPGPRGAGSRGSRPHRRLRRPVRDPPGRDRRGLRGGPREGRHDDPQSGAGRARSIRRCSRQRTGCSRTKSSSASSPGAAARSRRMPRSPRSRRRTRTRVLVTLGARGAALVGADGVVRRVPAPQVEAIDTTGAGDAFVGAFAVGLAMRLPEIDAVRLGIACASDSVLRRGTQASFPDAERCARLLAAL